jgi:hypothetical protein
MSYNANAWEFDVVQFIRDQFDYVGLAMPNFNGNDHLWSRIYAIAYGANEIAYYHKDRVELSFQVAGDQLEFQYRTQRTDTFQHYSKMTEAVMNMKDGVERVLSKELLPTRDDGLKCDHVTNLKIIASMMEGVDYIDGELVDEQGNPVDLDDLELDDFPADSPVEFHFTDIPPDVVIGRLE